MFGVKLIDYKVFKGLRVKESELSEADREEVFRRILSEIDHPKQIPMKVKLRKTFVGGNNHCRFHLVIFMKEWALNT